jgi:TP901 family phage tail tape measure protein
MDAGSITASLLLNVSNFNQNLQAAQNSMNSTSQSALKTSKSIDAIHKAALGVGVAVAVGMGAAVKTAANFESQMQSISAVTGITGSELDKLADLAKQAGRETAWSSLESAAAIEELAKAGLTAEQIMNGGLKGALDLASAGGLQLADAAAIASTALNAFKDDNLTVSESANILAGAANSSATDISELKFGLSAVSAVASGAGMSFKDTATALAVFAQNGLAGSDSGTSLKTMLMNLTPSTKEATELFKKLGIITADGANKFYDAEGRLKSLSEVTDVLRDALDELNPQQRGEALKEMFGSDAVRAGTILFKEGAEGVERMAEAMEKVTAADVAKVKLDSLNGAIEELLGTIESTGIELGQDFLPLLTDLAKGVTNVIRGLDSADISNFKSALAFAATTSAVALLLTTVGKLSLALRALSASPVGLAITGISLLSGVVAGAITAQKQMETVTLENAEAMLTQADTLKDNIREYDALRDKSKLTTEQLARFVDINSEITKTADPNIIAKLKDEQEKLRVKSGLSNEEFQKMLDLNGKIIEVVPESTMKITDQGNAILESTNKAKAFNKEQYEMIRLELEAQKAKAESKMSQYLTDEKRIIGEMKTLKEDMATLDGEYADQLKKIGDIEADLMEAEEAGNDSKAKQYTLDLAVQTRLLEKMKEKRAEQATAILDKQKELGEIQKQLGKLDEVKRKMVDLELKQAGINAKRGEEVKTIDTSIAKLEAAKKKLQDTTPVAQRNTGEYRNSIAAIDDQIAKLQGAKNKIGEIIGQAAVMNRELGKGIYKNVHIEETVSRQYRGNYGSPRENYHVGGIVGRGVQLPKLHVGGLAAQFAQAPNHNEIDTRLLRDEMVLTQAQQSNLFRMIDAGLTQKGESVTFTDPALVAAIKELASRPVSVEIDGREVAEATYPHIDSKMSNGMDRTLRMNGIKR